MERDLGVDDPVGPPTFDAAVREAVGRLGEELQEFQTRYERVPGTAYTDAEWERIEAVSRDLEEMVSRGEDAYEAVSLDGNAWYSVIEHLRRVTARLGDAIALMEGVEARWRRAADSEPETRSET